MEDSRDVDGKDLEHSEQFDNLEYSERFKYSEQSKLLLEQMPGFDKKDFEQWFEDNLSIGSNSILQYLVLEKNKAKRIIEVKKNGIKLK